MSNSPVTIISARNLGTTRFLIGSTPITTSGVEFVADLAGAEIGGDRRAGHARDDDRVDERRELPDRGEHEEPAKTIQRPEQHEEVRRLQPGRLVSECHRREQHREPAQAHREQELQDELVPVGVRRTDGRHQRLAGQHHHVADLLHARSA